MTDPLETYKQFETADQIVDDNPTRWEQAKAKPTLIGWFVGQTMWAMRGMANPEAIAKHLAKKLETG